MYPFWKCIYTLPTTHGVLVLAIASRPPSQAVRGSYSHKLAMSICTFCYLYSLALCYKTNRKSKLEESHFDQLLSVQRGGVQVGRSVEQNTRFSIARESGEKWPTTLLEWLWSAFAATLQLLQDRRGQDSYGGQKKSLSDSNGIEYYCTALAWLFCCET